MGTRVSEPSARQASELQSVGRALDLLDLLGSATPGGIRVGDAARRLNVDPATISRALATLVKRGYAVKLPDRGYSLGPRSIRLATHWYEPLIEKAAPHLNAIANASGETVFMLQLIGNEAVSLARTITRNRRARTTEDRSAYPLWATAAGRALLASVGSLARLELLPQEPYPTFTEHSLSNWQQLKSALRAGEQSGYFFERGEIDVTLACLAVPVVMPASQLNLTLAVAFDAEAPRAHVDRVREAAMSEAALFVRSLTSSARA